MPSLISGKPLPITAGPVILTLVLAGPSEEADTDQGLRHMSWEQTDIAMAPRAGRADELRTEAARYKQGREIIRQRRSQMFYSLRSRLSEGLATVVDWITPPERPPTEVLSAD